MEKLLELEERLKKAKAMLEAACKAEDKEDEEKKKKNPDEKEDAKLGEKVEEAVETHMKDNEKDEKKEGHKIRFEKGELEKAAGGPNKFGERKQAQAENTVREQRAPAVSIDPKSGAKTLVTPDQQVKAQVDAKASKKAKAEADAKARRDDYRKQGLIKFEKNGQWSMGDDC